MNLPLDAVIFAEMREENLVLKRGILFGDGRSREVRFYGEVDGVEHVKFHIGIFGFAPRVGPCRVRL